MAELEKVLVLELEFEKEQDSTEFRGFISQSDLSQEVKDQILAAIAWNPKRRRYRPKPSW